MGDFSSWHQKIIGIDFEDAIDESIFLILTERAGRFDVITFEKGPGTTSAATDIFQKTSAASFKVIDRQTATIFQDGGMEINIFDGLLKDIACIKLLIVKQLTGIDISALRDAEFRIADSTLAGPARLSRIQRRFTIG